MGTKGNKDLLLKKAIQVYLPEISRSWPEEHKEVKDPLKNHKYEITFVGIDGEETNVNWKRHDDGTREGFADLTVEEEIIVGPAEACAFLPNDIHSVRNTGETPSLSLHVYGYSPGSRNRSEFDPLNKTYKPCPQRIRNRA